MFLRLAGAGVLIAAALSSCSKAPEYPDLILHHGKIFTADSAAHFVEALAVRGDRVVAIGADTAIVRLAGPNTTRVDLAGKTVVPGFNDAHAHIGPALPGVVFATSADPTPDPAFAQVADSIRTIAARTPAGQWISTTVAERILSDPTARRAALDRIAPRHPVRLEAWTGHGIVLNGAALAALGIDDSVKDPLGGRLERDQAGRLTGLLEEYADFGAMRLLNQQQPESAWRAGFEDFARQSVQLGLTSIQNMATAFDAERTRQVLAGLTLPIRLRMIRFPGTTPSGRDVTAWRALEAPAGSRVTISGTKWILDGTPIERLAAFRAPYSDQPGWFGRLDFPPDTLRAIAQEALQANDQLLLHAVGDSAIALALRTMSALAPDSVWRRLRPRIEHGEGLAPDLIPLAKGLGVIVSQNPTHFALGAVAPTRYGPSRLPVLQPLKSLGAHGIPLALGSDGPINPFLNLMLAAMHPDNPAEAISIEAAVTAYTHGSAFAEFMERDKGRLVPGQLADLAVLSQDIFTIPLPQLPATTSVLTLVGGEAVWNPSRLIPAEHP